MKKPDEKEIQKMMKALDISREEALEVWRCDNDEEENEEQEVLDAAAKKVKIDHGAEALEKKKRKAPVRKPNEDKRELISCLEHVFAGWEMDYTVSNPERTIDFEFNGVSYSLNLVAHRPPKK